MLQGLYAAASGMNAQQAALDAVSNDIANADTTGYQSEIVGFHDLLYTSGGASNNMSVATGAGVAAQVMGRSSAQGNIAQTGQPLDIALQGPGYFAVTEAGGAIGLTRNGVLQIDSGGRLVNSQGLPLSPPVNLPPGTTPAQVSIAGDGTVQVGGRAVGRIPVVTVASPANLLAQGNSLFTTTPGSGPLRAVAGTRVQQGALESSNVDVSREMASMIEAQRSYSLASKAIDYQNQMLQIADGIKK